MHLAIYLAGKIKKGHEVSDEAYWSDHDLAVLREGLDRYELSLLNPAFRSDDLSDNQSVFGRDMLMVFSSHAVFVDARDRRGLGVGAEMMWAKINRIPVVTLAPLGTFYHKTEAMLLGQPIKGYTHPFVHQLSDKIVPTVEAGAAWIDQLMNDSSIEVKGPEAIHSAMAHYKESQLPHDLPMQDLLKASQSLKTRILA